MCSQCVMYKLNAYRSYLSAGLMSLTHCHTHTQGVPGGKVNILGGHSIGHSRTKSVYVHRTISQNTDLSFWDTLYNEGLM
jgi:hypothetical protein